jgi:transcription-repair coupling factor (superfamily II helicase)
VDIRDPLASLEQLPAFEVPVVALIPDTYIKDQSQRLYYYQTMMSARDEKALGEVQADVEDRYGHPPVEVRQAFAIMSLRMRARDIGLEKLDARQGRLSIVFKKAQDVPPRVFSILSKRKRDAYLTREQYVWPFTGDPIRAIEAFLTEFERATREYEEARAALPM